MFKPRRKKPGPKSRDMHQEQKGQNALSPIYSDSLELPTMLRILPPVNLTAGPCWPWSMAFPRVLT